MLDQSYWPAETSEPLSTHTVSSLLAERAAQHPDRLALVGVRHGDGAEVRLTYAELLHEARCIATALLRVADPGDYVALWAPNVVEWVLIQHGAAIAGVVLVALNPVLRAGELAYALDHSRPRVLIHAERSREYDLGEVAREAGASRPGLRLISLADHPQWRAESPDAEVVAATPTDPALPVMLQYTSGTTGSPKGVLLRHESLVNVAALTMTTLGVPVGAVAINPLPMFHTAACVIGTLGPLWLGGTEVLIEQFVPSRVLDTMRSERADVLFYVPAVLNALLETQRTRAEAAPSLAFVIGGASNVPASMIQAATDVFGAQVINLFGQTELSPVLTATRSTDSREDQLETVGRPLPHVDVKVVDPETGTVQPLGVAGEICARGYQQFVEYLHDPQATRSAVDTDGFVRTGDLGSMDARGFITLSGRLKDLIIRGGENISPAEIESCLSAHPEVVNATVFGLPDPKMGEIVAAAIAVRDARPDVAALTAHCRATLAPYKVPSRWFIAGELPTTPTGKVQKFKLADLVGTASLIDVTEER